MKRLYRLVIQGWVPVEIEEDEAATMDQAGVQELYENCAVNPYDLDDCTLRLDPATDADYAKYSTEEERY
jgi:hypothetical protein